MKFPYISTYPLIVEAFSDVKTLVKTLSFTEQDAYGWAVDAAREIGGFNYDRDTVYLNVKNHSCIIPKDFYLIESLFLCSRVNSSIPATPPVSPNYLTPQYWIASSILRPADVGSLKFCNRNCLRSDIPKEAQSYTIKVPPGVIKTSFKDGVIQMNYLKLPLDKDGIVMVQDEINTLKCIKAYIKRQLLAEKWYMQELRGDVWADINNEYDTYLVLAQQLQKSFDPSETAFRAAEQDNKYRIFGNPL